MNAQTVSTFFIASLALSLGAANGATAAPTTDQERIDSLLKQNQVLSDMVSSLKADSERPKTREELFAACMQAAKGSSAMAAESIGGHCNQLLKNQVKE